MLLDTNPWLLGLTMIVSTLHSIFDFLAFKNGTSPRSRARAALSCRWRLKCRGEDGGRVNTDIQFWQKRKSMEGLSVRTIIVNVVIQAIVFLYLMDNDTSFLILVSAGIGLLIEIWKIQKALIVKVAQHPWPQARDDAVLTKHGG